MSTDPFLADAERPVKLECRSVWKLFGAGAEDFLKGQAHDALDGAALAEAGLIGAVRNVNLSIREGEIFVIMGLSGSGKSTLVRCMSRLVEPTAGQIMFHDEDLLAASPKRMIDLVGLSGREDFFPRELSGGQQQRVGIARSLAVEPELWFLDEPFSALDPLIRREMQDEFIRLQAVLQKTIIFITHDFDEAIRLADRIAIMKDGMVDQVGTPEELVISPATDYVAEFTQAVSRGKVMQVHSIMQPVDSAPVDAGSVPSVGGHARVAEAAPMFSDGVERLAVVDSTGAVRGLLHRDDVVAVMMQG